MLHPPLVVGVCLLHVVQCWSLGIVAVLYCQLPVTVPFGPCYQDLYLCHLEIRLLKNVLRLCIKAVQNFTVASGVADYLLQECFLAAARYQFSTVFSVCVLFSCAVHGVFADMTYPA